MKNSIVKIIITFSFLCLVSLLQSIMLDLYSFGVNSPGKRAEMIAGYEKLKLSSSWWCWMD